MPDDLITSADGGATTSLIVGIALRSTAGSDSATFVGATSAGVAGTLGCTTGCGVRAGGGARNTFSGAFAFGGAFTTGIGSAIATGFGGGDATYRIGCSSIFSRGGSTTLAVPNTAAVMRAP